jgi:hypothetical protein
MMVAIAYLQNPNFRLTNKKETIRLTNKKESKGELTYLDRVDDGGDRLLTRFGPV